MKTEREVIFIAPMSGGVSIVIILGFVLFFCMCKYPSYYSEKEADSSNPASSVSRTRLESVIEEVTPTSSPAHLQQLQPQHEAVGLGGSSPTGTIFFDLFLAVYMQAKGFWSKLRCRFPENCK